MHRIVPGQYLAIDPKGRAIMIGAVEKQKLVFIMNRYVLSMHSNELTERWSVRRSAQTAPYLKTLETAAMSYARYLQ